MFAYQGMDLSVLSEEQARQLDMSSVEVAFVTMGGFVYLQVGESVA